jgi:hypothetical protein
MNEQQHQNLINHAKDANKKTLFICDRLQTKQNKKLLQKHFFSLKNLESLFVDLSAPIQRAEEIIVIAFSSWANAK